MKKKIFLIAAMCLCILGMAACATTDPTTVDYNGHSYSDLQASCQSAVDMMGSMSPADRTSIIANWDSYLSQGVPETQLNLVSRWDAAVVECGSFVDYGKFEVTKSGKTLTAAQTLIMADRDMILTMVYNSHSMELQDITIDPVYSVAEKMTTALLNTIMGMLIVFCVLILISLVIFSFKIFSYWENKAEKSVGSAPQRDAVVTQIETREVQQAPNAELVAVIAAAIAEAEGTSTDGFVVRSIRRR